MNRLNCLVPKGFANFPVTIESYVRLKNGACCHLI